MAAAIWKSTYEGAATNKAALIQDGLIEEVNGKVKIKNEQAFKELLFFSFLSVLLSERMRHSMESYLSKATKKLIGSGKYLPLPKLEKYAFLKYGSSILALLEKPSKIAFFPIDSFYTKEAEIFKNLNIGDGNESKCQIKKFLCLKILSLSSPDDGRELPECEKGNCLNCIKSMQDQHVELAGKSKEPILNCAFIPLKVSPEIAKSVLSDSELYQANHELEKYFNYLLSTFLQAKLGIEASNHSCELESPMLCHEVDVTLSNSEKEILLELTTMSDLKPGYAKTKIMNYLVVAKQNGKETHMLLFSLSPKEKVDNALSEASLMPHISLHEGRIGLFGLPSSLCALSSPEWPEKGFPELRELFDGLLEKIAEEVSQRIS